MEEFKIRKSIRCSDDGVNDYITALENFITNLKAENTNRLIFKLDELNGVIADDVQMIIDGEAFIDVEVTNTKTGEVEMAQRSLLKILSDSKDSKTFDRTMTLYGKLKDLKETANIVKAMIPEIEEAKANQKESIVFTTGASPYEEILRQQKSKK